MVVIPESYLGSLGKYTALMVLDNMKKYKSDFENERWYYEIKK